jgi:hypothetical protein
MKWLLGVVCVVAMGCEPQDNCSCSSLISISLGDSDYGVLTHPPTTVKLCLDDECHSFEVTSVPSSFPSDDADPAKAMSVVVSTNPARLSFITELRHTADTRDVKLEFSRANQMLISRMWADTPFTSVAAIRPSEQEEACVSSCTSAVINDPGGP